jgi:hypothetical protein
MPSSQDNLAQRQTCCAGGLAASALQLHCIWRNALGVVTGFFLVVSACMPAHASMQTALNVRLKSFSGVVPMHCNQGML